MRSTVREALSLNVNLTKLKSHFRRTFLYWWKKNAYHLANMSEEVLNMGIYHRLRNDISEKSGGRPIWNCIPPPRSILLLRMITNFKLHPSHRRAATGTFWSFPRTSCHLEAASETWNLVDLIDIQLRKGATETRDEEEDDLGCQSTKMIQWGSSEYPLVRLRKISIRSEHI